jgi:hypothetical protein
MSQMRTPVAMEARSGVMAAPCSAGFGGGAGAAALAEAEADAETGGRRRSLREVEATVGGGVKRGLEELEEGREWEREMGLEERRRRENEREGRRERGAGMAPRWWQVSGDAAVEDDAMAAAAAAAGEVDQWWWKWQGVGEEGWWGLKWMDGEDAVAGRALGVSYRIRVEWGPSLRRAWTRRWCTSR